jgi:hypothetical protein
MEIHELVIEMKLLERRKETYDKQLKGRELAKVLRFQPAY